MSYVILLYFLLTLNQESLSTYANSTKILYKIFRVTIAKHEKHCAFLLMFIVSYRISELKSQKLEKLWLCSFSFIQALS